MLAIDVVPEAVVLTRARGASALVRDVFAPVPGRSDLKQMRQTTVDLPIACVEGWSADATWTGVRVRELRALVGAPTGSDVRVVSLQKAGPYRETVLAASFADDPLTLLAIELNGETLSIDHGYPCRLIAPNRPGVLQTKWVDRLEVTA